MPIIVGTSGPDTLDGTSGDDYIRGFEDDDTLNGLAGNDYLDGGTGNDIMNGGADDDIYIVDALGDVVNESVGQGFDIVYAIASYVLATGVQVERLSSTDHPSTVAKDLTGNDYVTDIFGNDGVNVLTGGGANNLLLGFGGADTLNGLGGHDSLLGMDGDDILNGGAGNDYFEGGAGADILNGGADDDLYIVDSSDSVGELTGEGFDTIYATTSYVLAAGVAVERLSSTDHLSTVAKDLTGNDLVTDIYGNNGTNVLTGGNNDNIILGFGGSDTLEGGGGADLLFGMNGADVLNGGAGNDHLEGGSGSGEGNTLNGGTDDDTYIVYSGDIVSEMFDEGFDIVYAVGNYVLTAGSYVEVLFAADTASTDARNLTGNDLVWEIYGNNGVNTLTGGSGASSLFGLGGNDTLIGGGGNDVLNGGAGVDHLVGGTGDDIYYLDGLDTWLEQSNQGSDTALVGFDFWVGGNLENAGTIDVNATTDIRLFGNSGANRLTGNAGANLLTTGVSGNDVLTGNGGADIFNITKYITNAISVTPQGQLSITDFQQGVDKIRLDVTKFPGILGNVNFLTNGAVATAPDTRIVYDPATGNLRFDLDGAPASGPGSDIPALFSAVFATIQSGLTLTAADFIIEANRAPVVLPDSYSLTFSGANVSVSVNPVANDTDIDGLALWPIQIGPTGQPLIDNPSALTPRSFGGIYGNLFGNGGSLTYTLNASDPDTAAIAPGQTVTETYVYVVSDGYQPEPNNHFFMGGAMTATSTITISITREASGALVSSASQSSAMAAEAPGADPSSFARAGDAAFAGDDGAFAPPDVRAAADYLISDLWAV